MAKVHKFRCDMCGNEEQTTEVHKPKPWKRLAVRGISSLRRVEKAVVVCPECDAVLTDTAETVTSVLDRFRQELTMQQMLMLVGSRVSAGGDMVQPAEIDEDDEDEVEIE